MTVKIDPPDGHLRPIKRVRPGRNNGRVTVRLDSFVSNHCPQHPLTEQVSGSTRECCKFTKRRRLLKVGFTMLTQGTMILMGVAQTRQSNRWPAIIRCASKADVQQ